MSSGVPFADFLAETSRVSVFDGVKPLPPSAPAYGDMLRRLFQSTDFETYGKGGASGDMIIDMNVDTYIGLCEPVPADDAKRHANLQKLVDSGEIDKFPTIPSLSIKLIEDGDAKVIGHDGRHRAMLVRSLGYHCVPVRLMAFGFMWGAPMPLVKGKSAERVPYPKWLWCQNDKSVKRDKYRFRFPVPESDSGKAYAIPRSV